jgi:hypothetical protein
MGKGDRGMLLGVPRDGFWEGCRLWMAWEKNSVAEQFHLFCCAISFVLVGNSICFGWQFK